MIKMYKQMKSEGYSDEDILDYMEYCETGAESHNFEGVI